MKTLSSLKSTAAITGLAILVAANPVAHAQNAAPLAPAAEIKSLPFVITAPGLYVVRKNLSVASGATAISINVPASASGADVTIDLGGKVITSLAQSGIGIVTNSGKRVTVRNGTLRGFARGMTLIDGNDTAHFTIKDVTVLGGTTGISAGGATAEISGCRVLEAGNAAATDHTYGIASTAKSVTLTDNVVDGVVKGPGKNSYGIHISQAQAASVEDNTVTTEVAGNAGIYVSMASSPANAFVCDNVISNFGTGLAFFGNGGKYRGNLTRNCPTAFSGGTAVGNENN